MKTAVIHLLEEADVRDLIGGKPFAIEGAGGSRFVIATEKSFDPARLFNGGGQLERKQLEEPKRKTRRRKGAAAKQPPKKGQLVCDDCGKIFKAQGWLDKHRQKAHGARPEAPGTAGRKHLCKSCGHRSIEHHQGKFECLKDQCNCMGFEAKS